MWPKRRVFLEALGHFFFSPRSEVTLTNAAEWNYTELSLTSHFFPTERNKYQSEFFDAEGEEAAKTEPEASLIPLLFLLSDVKPTPFLKK